MTRPIPPNPAKPTAPFFDKEVGSTLRGLGAITVIFLTVAMFFLWGCVHHITRLPFLKRRT